MLISVRSVVQVYPGPLVEVVAPATHMCGGGLAFLHVDFLCCQLLLLWGEISQGTVVWAQRDEAGRLSGAGAKEQSAGGFVSGSET